jgi:hypothetical protein
MSKHEGIPRCVTLPDEKTKVIFFLNRISLPLKKANISRQMSSLAGNRTPFEFS